MPEDFNASRKLINVPDEDRSDTSDEDNRHESRHQASTKQKMREIVQNFFNCNKFSTKKLNNETVDTKSKSCSLLANLMCQDIKQIRLDDSKYVDSRSNSPTNVNDESDLIDRKNACLGDEESNFKKNDQNQVKQKTRSWRDILMTKSKTEVKNASDESSSKGKADVLKDNRYEHLHGNVSGSASRKTYIRGNSGLEYDRIRQSLVTENERLQQRSTYNAERCQPAESCQPAEVNGTKSKVNFVPRLKKFLENNVRKIWKRNLHTGGVVLMNDENTNVGFTPFKSDLDPIVDTTVTSQTLSAPNLLCGGKVIFEGFTDSFKTPNYYMENPLAVNFCNDKPVAKSSTFIPPPTEPRVRAILSGGNVVDNSSKGVSLPDLFPSQEPALYSPPVLQHLSWGHLKTHEVENRISLDLTTYSLKVEEINSPELPYLGNKGKFSRVNNSETICTPMNTSKSHPNIAYPPPIAAEHSQRHCSVSRNNPRSPGIHNPKSQASRNYSNTTNRSSSNNLNSNNAATRMSRADIVRPLPAARNVTDNSAENVVDQRNRKSNTNGQKNTSKNPKLHDLCGRSRYL